MKNYLYKLDLSDNAPFFLFFEKKLHEPIIFFFAGDIANDLDNGKIYLLMLEEVLNGKKTNDSAGGNVCGIDIEKDITTIEYLFFSSDPKDWQSCQIETQELRKLIILWMTEVEKFSKIKQSNIFKSFDPEYKIYCFLASIYHQFVDNFDLLLDQYLWSETAESRPQLIAAIEQFLQSNESVELKNEYIQLCADSVHFDELKIAPVAWLEIILQYIKNNKNYSQSDKNTISS